MRQALSSNQFSTDGQLEDAVSYLEHNDEIAYRAFVEEFPEWPHRTMGEHSSWFDTEAMRVDVEWSSWAIDWIESHTNIHWEDGEPYVDNTVYVEVLVEIDEQQVDAFWQALNDAEITYREDE